jgi:heterodisulfide reductase subunit B
MYPQLLGLAMGIGEDELGLSMNRVPADGILAHLTG